MAPAANGYVTIARLRTWCFFVRLLAAAVVALMPAAAHAHPAPFTYLDIRLQQDDIAVTLVAHVFDLAHDLQVADPTRLLDARYLETRRAELLELFNDRLTLGAARQRVQWTNVGTLPERQSVVLVGTTSTITGAVPVHAYLFPYDPAHQTFVNVFEGGSLNLQAILDSSKTDLEYFPGSTSGFMAVLRRFGVDGARHVVSGLEHWLFLAGVLLLGGGWPVARKTLLAFVAADALTAALIAFDIAHPAARLTDPALALSIVYIGADNLMVKGGRDVRPLIAVAFGALHGFWFGGALALMDLPRRAVVWSLVSFDIGALVAAAGLLAALTVALEYLRPRLRGSVLIRIGSSVVALGGVYLFVQRVFFPAGLL
jgi:hypothetical protein